MNDLEIQTRPFDRDTFRFNLRLSTGLMIALFQLIGYIYAAICIPEIQREGRFWFGLTFELIFIGLTVGFSFFLLDKYSRHICHWLTIHDTPQESHFSDGIEAAWIETINFPFHFVSRAIAVLGTAKLLIFVILSLRFSLTAPAMIVMGLGFFLVGIGNWFVFMTLIHHWLLQPVRETFRPHAELTQRIFEKRPTVYMPLRTKIIVTIISLSVTSLLSVAGYAFLFIRQHVTDEALVNMVLWRLGAFVILGLLLSGIAAYVIAFTLSQSVNEVRIKLKDIAEQGGDLRQRVVIMSGDEIGKLVYWFNDFLGKMQQIVKTTQSTVSEVARATEAMTQVNEQVAASVQEMTSGVHQVSQGAQAQSTEINQVVGKAHQFAELAEFVSTEAIQAETSSQNISEASARGHKSSQVSQARMESLVEVTKESVNAVNMLIQKTNEIRQFVGTVQGIASQTNLLALNAAIEAARAGEHGRGFSVVAEEVRKLARDSGTALRQISDRVTDIQTATDEVISWISQVEEEVTYGRAMFDSMGEILEKINTQIQENSARIHEISSFSQQQQGEILHLVSSLSAVAHIAQQNDASSAMAASAIEMQMASINEVATHHHNLYYLVEKLREEIQKFKV